MAIIIGSAERAGFSACQLRGGCGSYIVCSGGVVEGSQQGYEHVIAFMWLLSRLLRAGGVEIAELRGL
jgi:hypothetical protein